MNISSFEDLIRSHISLSIRPNDNGWWAVLCKVCHDHGRKGPRAGFKFDHDCTTYNCFNCGHVAKYYYTEPIFTEGMSTVLNAFNIPINEQNKILFNAIATHHSDAPVTNYKSDITPPTIVLPPYITPLDGTSDDVIDQYACEYLQNDRGINWKDANFFIGRAHTDPQSKKWFARLILPVYKDNQLIFYTGRDLTGTRIKKYMSPSISRDNVLFGFDQLTKTPKDPLYVVEGWFDAYHIHGIAVFGNKMTANQLIWLERCPRPKVIIPDRYGDGYLLAEQALERGWAVSTPDIGECKDVNEAMMKYGYTYTLLSIKKSTFSGLEGQVRVKTYCTNDRN